MSQQRVLVVDDEANTRRVLEIMLQKMGLETRAAGNGQEALTLTQRESFDLILTDLRMPEMDGLALLEALRTQKIETPVILLTAYGTVESAVHAMKLGAYDYILRPFDVEAVERTITRALTTERTRRENLFLREEIEKGWGEFVGRSEVRTPLGVLRSSAQLLERSLEVKDEESRELLQLVQNEVARIERVVSALINLGRPREMHPKPSSLSQILFRTADFVDAQARQKHVTIRRRTVDPDPVVLCDPELIHQVALNLLVNAVQILPDGGAIEMSILPARNGYAGFEVRDDGPGMSQEVCARIFEPYFTRRCQPRNLNGIESIPGSLRASWTGGSTYGPPQA